MGHDDGGRSLTAARPGPAPRPRATSWPPAVRRVPAVLVAAGVLAQIAYPLLDGEPLRVATIKTGLLLPPAGGGPAAGRDDHDRRPPRRRGGHPRRPRLGRPRRGSHVRHRRRAGAA